MSATFEEFLSRFEALTPANRSRAVDLILLELDSDPSLDKGQKNAAVKLGISQKQLIRFERALEEVNDYRAAQND